jgi:hypothetical protein
MVESGSPEFARRFAANSMRQRPEYSIGEIPLFALNFTAS